MAKKRKHVKITAVWDKHRRKIERENKKMPKAIRNVLMLNGLGALGEPVTIVGGGALLVSGAIALITALKPSEQIAPMVQEITRGCGPAEVEKALAQAAAGASTGAATGAAAGGYGAGVGAGGGALVALAPEIMRCGPDAVKKGARALCAKADQVVAQIRQKGGAVPKAWNGFSCDEKIAWVAALGPYGVAAVLAGALTGRLATDTANEVKRYSTRAESAVRTIAKKLGKPLPKIDLDFPKVSFPKLF